MKQHLLDLFAFNDQTNRKLLGKIAQLQDQAESIRLFSHLINCQYKWLARIQQDPRVPEMSWWEPLYPFGQLEPEWEKSLTPWLDYLRSKSETELAAEVIFTGSDGSRWASTPQDIALQLNFHSVHHRAQIQMLIRAEGLKPGFVDYIGTKYHRLEEN
ncbi:MAG: DinB family protein [Calditrichaeota bacterium]|nr:DinB family protein [Calditrichota bacterium]HQU71451.1 DinB family protein [Calditrichia bacterium]